ncbi:hypothetical protein FEM48_Zijuj11G0123900 [Ziziphus jujuba var. spinosa]|uniref:Uncharacterized protein n=1 Tax=Ziziphus jujuba var. spinosa TaxID=714518 RepID=A0A978UIX1_ZIZJJ|nr:hypothetical protein FEM48_Zijuj11G0123900 [Ziziphus jujuba var. spinosa]
MQAEAEKQHSWKINIHAKAKSFHFRFKATNISPTWKFHRLSVLLKIRRFLLLTVNSESSASNAISKQRHQGKLISKFLRLFKKIRLERTKNQHPEAKFPSNRLQRFSYKEPICVGSLFLGILACLLSPPIFQAIAIYSLVMLLFVAFLFKKCKTRKPSKLLILLIAAAWACPLLSLFHLSYFLKYDKGFASNFVWKAWNIVASLIWNSLVKMFWNSIKLFQFYQ